MPAIIRTLNIDLCERQYAAAHEKFLFALQNKHEDLGKYAQRKDASTFVIKKGNQELQDAAAYMNKAEAIIDLLKSEIKQLRLKQEITKLKATLPHYEL
jgi:hypothetical protein